MTGMPEGHTTGGPTAVTSAAVSELSATLAAVADMETAVETKSGVGRSSAAAPLPVLALICTRKYLLAPMVPVRVTFPDQLPVDPEG